MKPDDKLPAWSGSAGSRVMQARFFLSVHGFLSQSETRSANKRIAAWAKKHGFEITSPVAVSVPPDVRALAGAKP
jgi:hypothetical protein